MSSIAIIGFGSIGERHYKALRDLGEKVLVVSRRKDSGSNFYQTLEECFENNSPSIVWICNKTSEHLGAMRELSRLNYDGLVLVEKPIFDKCKDIPENNFRDIFVSYNMRFHEVLKYLKEALRKETVISSNIYAGNYLPSWRPSRDYQEVYSSSKKEGGGVIRDLSHELDYALWLFGYPEYVIALGGKYSDLQIDSDDLFSLLVKHEECPVVNITINYLDRISQRFLIIHTLQHTYKADLVKGSLVIDDQVVIEESSINDTYKHQAITVLNKDFSQWCSFDEALTTMRIIEGAEISNDSGKRVLI